MADIAAVMGGSSKHAAEFSGHFTKLCGETLRKNLNPQKYVPNIFTAAESDFTKATHTVYCNSINATYVELPVMKE